MWSWKSPFVHENYHTGLFYWGGVEKHFCLKQREDKFHKHYLLKFQIAGNFRTKIMHYALFEFFLFGYEWKITMSSKQKIPKFEEMCKNWWGKGNGRENNNNQNFHINAYIEILVNLRKIQNFPLNQKWWWVVLKHNS